MAGTVIEKKTFSGGQTFTVVVNDILYEPVQCIVNAANGMLAHGGGVAAVIADAAGSAMLADCREIISKRGRIPSGHAVVSKAGDLPFRGLIHAVGPKMGEGDEERKLVQALREAFDLAEERRWKSLSFPGRQFRHLPGPGRHLRPELPAGGARSSSPRTRCRSCGRSACACSSARCWTRSGRSGRKRSPIDKPGRSIYTAAGAVARPVELTGGPHGIHRP